ncbi:MAG: hypothetical protein ACKO96_34030, partial [Flammeovirgaceae bacterium]
QVRPTKNKTHHIDNQPIPGNKYQIFERHSSPEESEAPQTKPKGSPFPLVNGCAVRTRLELPH